MKAFHHAPLCLPHYEAIALIGWIAVGLLGALTLKFTPLNAHVPTAWGLLMGLMMCRRMPGAWVTLRLARHLRQTTVTTQSLTALSKIREQNDQALYLGDGFDWRPHHAQWAHEVLAAGGPYGRGGKAWVHQLEPRTAPLFQPLSETQGHMLIVGTTGAGKTRTFDLLIAQAIGRGEAVIILDPKGDRDIRVSAERALAAAGRKEALIIFHPAFPKESVRLDPLRNFNRPSELACRIAGAIPSTHVSDPFKAFGQRALDQMIQGLLFLERRPSLTALRQILEGGPEGLAHEVLEHHFKTVLGPGWKTKVPQSTRGKSKGAMIAGLAGIYREQLSIEHPAAPVEGVLALYEHDRNHFGKMVSSLLPVMNILTSGPLKDLLSPDPDDRDDVRPITDLGRVIERRQVAYLGLDALSDGPAAAMIGSLLLADLTAVAGERYNAGTALRPVNVYIDEAAEVINDPCIQLLNKGRGAGIRMTIATQTLADFTARMGTEARALQILGNVNNLIALRVLDAETQLYITRNLPRFRRRAIMRTLGNSTLGPDPKHFSGNLGERLIEEDADLFPQALLGQLPDLHYLGKLSGGRIIKGRIPLLIEETRD